MRSLAYNYYNLLFPLQTYVIAFDDDQDSFQPEQKVNDLHPTDDGEASEESHGASNETQLGLRLDFLVSLNLVKGGCFKSDFNNLKGWLGELVTWWLHLYQKHL